VAAELQMMAPVLNFKRGAVDFTIAAISDDPAPCNFTIAER
jgi:hypothetical protein